jgi:hypothetical protein
MKSIKELEKKLAAASPKECAKLVKKLVIKKLYNKEKHL